MIYKIIELILIVFEVFIFFAGAELFFQKKVLNRVAIIWAFVYYIMLFLKSVEGWDLEKGILSVSLMFIILALLSVILPIIYSCSWIQSIIYVVGYYIVLAFLELIVIAVLRIVLQVNITEFQQPSLVKTICFFMTIGLRLTFVFLLRKRQLKKRNQEFSYILLVTLINNFVLNLALIILYRNVKRITIEGVFSIMLTVMVVITVLNALTFSYMLKILKRNNETDIQLQYMKDQQVQNTNIELVSRGLRELRHDMNNHIGIIYGLCNTKQFNELKQYVGELNNVIKEANEIIVIPQNKILSLVLNNKKELMQEKGIEFEYNIQIQKLKLKDIEISSLFGNILDNAIEACEKVDEERYIKLSISENESEWIIECLNPCAIRPVFKDNEFTTIKRNHTNHGIGTRAMESIIERYNGM